jgi:hypothetical protein
MPIKEFHDAVAQTGTVTGTGNITLSTSSAPFLGRRTLQSVASVNARIPYRIEAVDATTYQPTGQWETGEGTYLGSDIFERTTPQSGSSTPPVSFTAGTKRFSVTTNAADLRLLGQLSGSVSYTYNADGTVATYTVNGVLYTMAYTTVAGKRLVSTVTGGGITQTFTYNSDGSVASIA